MVLARGWRRAQIEWRKELVGNPTGVLAGGPITAMSTAAAAWRSRPCSRSRNPSPPSTCASATRRRARKAGDRRGRVLPHHPLGRLHAPRPQGDPKDPVAAAAGTFMLGTKGEVTQAQLISRKQAKSGSS